MKIHKYEYGSALICEENCKFKSTCANHDTAGDFRSEDGFTPEIIKTDLGFYECKTILQPIHEMSTRNEPENIHKLGTGMVIEENGKLEVYNFYDE